MKIPTGWIAPCAIFALVLLNLQLRLENQLTGALENERVTTERLWKVKKAKLEAAVARLEHRAHVADSLARLRPRIVVTLPAPRTTTAVPVAPDSAATDTGTVVARDTLATVTINDTAYAVPVRVAQVVEALRIEAVNADTMRADVKATVEAAHEAVPAADTAIAAAKKKPNWFMRQLGKATTVLCAAGGAAIGGAIGSAGGGAGAIPGAIMGAGAGAGICEVAR